MPVVTALFDQYEDAERAVDELQRSGFDSSQISVAARDQVIQERLAHQAGTAELAATGAAGGALAGGLGGLLLGVGALMLPGIGPLVAAGPLATVLASTATGAGLGAGAGGLLGALIGLGIPEEQAQVYTEGLKRGAILIAVETDEQHATEAQHMMGRTGAIDIDTRREEWRSSGWKEYDATQDPEDPAPPGLTPPMR